MYAIHVSYKVITHSREAGSPPIIDYPTFCIRIYVANGVELPATGPDTLLYRELPNNFTVQSTNYTWSPKMEVRMVMECYSFTSGFYIVSPAHI